MIEEKVDPRIPEIVKRKVGGQTYTAMAKDMGVSRKTVYNLRTGDAYLEIVDEMFTSLMESIEEMSKSDSHTIKIDAIKEKGRILRALLPSLSVIQHRADPEKARVATANEITKKRKRMDEVIKSLKLTPEQYKTLEDNIEEEH